MRQLAAIAMFSALALLAGGATAAAQVRGTPASVTSSAGQKTMAPGTPASVTSLGPLGWQAPRFSTQAQMFSTQAQPFSTEVRPFSTEIGFGFGFGSPREHPDSRRRFHRRVRAVPVFLPGYAPYYAPPVVVIEQPAPVVVVERPGLTIFDRGYEHERPAAPPAAAYAPAPRPQYDDPPEQIATTLIFKDGRELEVFNYAIVGDLLYNLNGPGPRRIRLDELDVEATIRVNDERGVLFKLPAGRG